MPRIGKNPITVPAGVEVKVDGSTVTVKGPKGTLTKEFKPVMKITVDGAVVTVERPDDEAANRSLHGLTRTLINNMIIGVTEGYQKVLEINGVGNDNSLVGVAIDHVIVGVGVGITASAALKPSIY